MLRLHIAPYFDSRRITLGKLTAGDLEDYYSVKLTEGLSPNTIIKHHAIIRSALQWAVKHRYIRENVADFAAKPERIRYNGAAPYSVEEIVQLLTLTQNESIAVPIFLASFYGLLHIDTTVVREKAGEQILTVVRAGTTKTNASRRSLPLCQYTYQYFVNLQQRQQQQRAICGTGYDTEFLDFVCVDDLGKLLQPDYVSQKFQQVLAKYQLRRIRFHDLRHSCATIMMYLGYSLKDIQTWLGHSNYNFTADTYVHSLPAAHKDMADRLAERLPDFIDV